MQITPRADPQEIVLMNGLNRRQFELLLDALRSDRHHQIEAIHSISSLAPDSEYRDRIDDLIQLQTMIENFQAYGELDGHLEPQRPIIDDRWTDDGYRGEPPH